MIFGARDSLTSRSVHLLLLLGGVWFFCLPVLEALHHGVVRQMALIELRDQGLELRFGVFDLLENGRDALVGLLVANGEDV